MGILVSVESDHGSCGSWKWRTLNVAGNHHYNPLRQTNRHSGLAFKLTRATWLLRTC